MVPHTGKAPCADTVKPVNRPEPAVVKEGPGPVPLTLNRQPVEAIEDRWRIDDEWWRPNPVSRLYFAVTLAGGRCLVIYKDLLTNCWYRQPY